MKKKIILAEDEKIIALDISRQLQKLGYEVASVVSTGEEALSECRRNSPDAVLMDIQLKGQMNGFEAASMIHKEYGIPIIHLSGSGTTVSSGNTSYPHIFLPKPFHRHELKEALEKALKS